LLNLDKNKTITQRKIKDIMDDLDLKISLEHEKELFKKLDPNSSNNIPL